ncbi:unnamed protein product [Rotaria sp. Silwood2]|nr:unnamed protein product [Rotaria sp. Silwood2]CAF2502817.1 unnamed protein product [Rotaria sp. Silwood2]CAF2900566.1 unnamed protein product [Rotaria sp. Silwood2]CAF3925615.1 unnamed protein product [Rotaria sp. Silwood2]CAF3932073.1 unnamed protein product [Rotaria sp. Silwood2]
MNLLDIVNHFLYMIKIDSYFKNSTASTDEIAAAPQLFKVQKSFEDDYFSERYIYDILEFHDEITDEEEFSDEILNDNDNEDVDIKNRFT